MLKQKLVLGAAALALSGAALAAQDDFSAPQMGGQGIYADANFGWATHDETPKSSIKSQDGFALNMNLGYQFSQNLGTEFGFFMLPDVTTKAGESIKNNYSYDLAVKGMLPFGGQFNAFAKLGVGMSTGKLSSNLADAGSQSGVNGFGALGLSWMPAAMPNLSVNVQGFAFTKTDKLKSRLGVLGGLGYLFAI
jgi:opacity protein-like surface antigen